MPALYGYKQQWNDYPDWLSRYDFVVKAPSPSPSPSLATPMELHVERASGPLSRVVRYRAAPRTRTNGRGRGASGLLRRRASLYFTSFFYKDENGQDHEVTREELSTAFRKLVGEWHDLFALAQAVHVAWDSTPFTCSGHEERIALTARELDLESTFFMRLKDVAKRWGQIGWRMFWEAEFMSQNLSYLSDLEDSGQLPRPFTHFPGRIDGDTSDRFRYRLRLRKVDGQVDDYALRSASLINSREETPDAIAIRSELEALLVDLLQAKGYDGATEARKYYPPPDPKGAHRPPRKKE